MESDTHRRDPSAKRTVLVVIVSIALLSAVVVAGMTALRPRLEAWVLEDVRTRLTIVIAVLMVIASGPPLALAGYLWQFGRQVVASRRFPPPGARLMQDTPIVSGEAARRRGRTLQVFAAGVAASAVLIAVMLVRLALLLRAA